MMLPNDILSPAARSELPGDDRGGGVRALVPDIDGRLAGGCRPGPEGPGVEDVAEPGE